MRECMTIQAGGYMTEQLETIELDKYTQFKVFNIHEPRWYDKKVLLAEAKLKRGKTPHNKVVIEARGADGERYYPDLYISKARALKFPKQSNGVIDCRVIPISEFKVLKISERSVHDAW